MNSQSKLNRYFSIIKSLVKSASSLPVLATAIAVALSGSAQAVGTTYTWTNAVGGAQSWTTGANWSNGNVPSPVSGDTVDFSTVDIAADTTLTLGADRTASYLKFGDTNGVQNWIVSAGNKITLAGSTPSITVNQNSAILNCVIAGTAGLAKSGGGTLALSGSNTYSGATTLNSGNSGTVIIQGLQALSPNTAITQNQVSSGGTLLKLLDDSGGAVTLPNTLTLNTVNGNGINNQANFIFVGNNSTANGGSNPGSTVTGETIAVAKLTMINNAQSGGSDTIGWQTISGANGYRLQINSVDLPSTVGLAKSVAAYFVPTTASVTLAGTIKQSNSNPGNQLTLQLDGTASSNYVTGAIMNATDYTNGSNTNAKPLNVTKSSTSTWTLSGTNTYTGATTINAGILEIGGAGVLGGGSYAGAVANSTTFRYNSTVTQTLSGVISGAGVLVKDNTGTLILGGVNSYNGATTNYAGTLLGMVGGSCSNSAITATNMAAVGVVVTNNTKTWTCSSLTFATNSAGTQLQFNFGVGVTPSIDTNTVPLKVTGNLAFKSVPTVVVNITPLVTGTYPLLTVGGTAPTNTVPVLSGVPGYLAWSGAGKKTLYLTAVLPGTVLMIQ